MSGGYNVPHQLKNSFSKEMYEEVEETFRMLDTNQTGLITKKQMRLAEKVLGLIVDSKDNISGDESDNGELIDFEHFVGSILEQMEKPHWISAASREAFGIFDKDGNGHLDAVEMKRVMNKMGEELTEAEIEDQLRHYDIDGDFQMVANEFVKVVTEKF